MTKKRLSAFANLRQSLYGSSVGRLKFFKFNHTRLRLGEPSDMLKLANQIQGLTQAADNAECDTNDS